LGKETSRPFASALIVLELERELLYGKINKRVEMMVEQGLMEEAKSVFPYKTLSSLQTVGYQELFEYFEGKTALGEAIEKIKNNSRQYARKQETWFRRYDGAFRISALEKKRIAQLVSDLTQ
jgi:tRNA dimethylallyltransferase